MWRRLTILLLRRDVASRPFPTGSPNAVIRENAPMTAHNRTLLAKLAPMFGAQTENLAVAALGHILWGSQAARRALSDLLAAGGATVGEIAQVRTQATGQEGERPDLAGFDRAGRERVLIGGTGRHDFRAGWTGTTGATRAVRSRPSALQVAAARAGRSSSTTRAAARPRASAVGLADDGRRGFDAWLDQPAPRRSAPALAARPGRPRAAPVPRRRAAGGRGPPCHGSRAVRPPRRRGSRQRGQAPGQPAPLTVSLAVASW